MTSFSSTATRLPIARLVAVFALLSVAPLALLTYWSTRLAGEAVSGEVEARISATAAITAELVHEELQGLGELVESYAGRPHLVASLGDGTRARHDRGGIRLHLAELRRTRPGIYTTFLARPDGKLIDVVPATPSIVGKDFSFRDWYRGVSRTQRTYVSEAYRTQAKGRPLVVAVATTVRAKRTSDDGGEVLAILVAAYSLDHIQEVSNQVAAPQGVRLRVTDQRGVLVASPGEIPRALVPRRDDPRVAAALRGRSGTMTLDTPDGRRLSAYAPVREIGWTVTASVPANTAFAAVGKLRSTVAVIATVLGLVLLGGLSLLGRALRERRRAEEAAQRQASINRAVLDASPDGILLVDPDGAPLLTNAALHRLAIAPPAAAAGAGIYDRIDEIATVTSDPDAFRAWMETVARDPRWEGSREVDLADGRVLQIYTSPVDEGSGSLIGRIFTARDMTGEREAERLKSDLVATVSHELRTPLASILGFAELLSERDPETETRKRYVNTIYGEAKRLTELINDFLDLQRMEEGRFRLALEPLELSEILKKEVELFAGQSSTHVLELDLPPEHLRVTADPDRITQLVGNLISNAIKYSPLGGRVEVGATTSDGAVRVSVTDQGVGIPAEQQRQIFTKFFRVDSSDTRAIGGTGLGLALCREIAEAHGGKIGFESVEGQGSTFWFELPAAHRRTGGPGRHILVIEDDPAAASLLSEYLGGDGYAVEVAATGEDGIALAEEDPPALVCLDIGLPGELDGWEVLARLKATPATADIPVIVCTAGEGNDRAAALGAADFLTKPFAAATLRDSIERLLPRGRGSVLVVDDDESVRALVVESLARDDLDLREAGDGDEALAAVARQRPDVIVLDLMMPGLDGFSVLERLQFDHETREIPVVVLTARRLSATERAILSERAVSLLEKSEYSAAELRRLIDRALGRERLDRSADELVGRGA